MSFFSTHSKYENSDYIFEKKKMEFIKFINIIIFSILKIKLSNKKITNNKHINFNYLSNSHLNNTNVYFESVSVKQIIQN